MRVYKAAIAILTSALIILSVGDRACAQFEILVFEFQVAETAQDKWMGKALTDYTIRMLNSGGVQRTMPREELNRLSNRILPTRTQVMSFDNMDRVRQHVGAAAIIEGVLQPRRNGIDFIGTFIDIDMSVLKELSYSISGNSYLELADKMREKLAKEIGLDISGGFEQIAETANMDSYTTNWNGVYLYETGDPARAMPLFEKAISQDPKYPEPYINSGKILLERTELNKAEDRLKKAVEIAPEDPRARFLLGLVGMLLRKTDVSERELLKALDLYPENPEYVYQLGMLFKSAYKYSQSKEMFLKAVTMDQSLYNAWYELAVIYSLGDQDLNKKRKTIEYLRNAVKWGGKKIVERMRNDTDFDYLRDDPDFQVIMKSVH